MGSERERIHIQTDFLNGYGMDKVAPFVLLTTEKL